MPNMSYCRFENTYRDLVDCYENINDTDLSNRESEYREKLIDVCREILEEYELNKMSEWDDEEGWGDDNTQDNTSDEVPWDLGTR